MAKTKYVYINIMVQFDMIDLMTEEIPEDGGIITGPSIPRIWKSFEAAQHEYDRISNSKPDNTILAIALLQLKIIDGKYITDHLYIVKNNVIAETVFKKYILFGISVNDDYTEIEVDYNHAGLKVFHHSQLEIDYKNKQLEDFAKTVDVEDQPKQEKPSNKGKIHLFNPHPLLIEETVKNVCEKYYMNYDECEIQYFIDRVEFYPIEGGTGIITAGPNGGFSTGLFDTSDCRSKRIDI